MQLQLREHGQPGLCHTRHRTSSFMWTAPRQTNPASPPIEESCSLAEFTPIKELAMNLAAADASQGECFAERARTFFEKVYSNLRQQLSRKPDDKMEDFDVNTLTRRMFFDCHSASRSSSWKR